MQLLTTVLVENNADLIRMEVSQMISSYDHESLKLMYSLLDRVEDGVKPIVNGEHSIEYLVFTLPIIILNVMVQKWKVECLLVEN